MPDDDQRDVGVGDHQRAERVQASCMCLVLSCDTKVHSLVAHRVLGEVLSRPPMRWRQEWQDSGVGPEQDAR